MEPDPDPAVYASYLLRLRWAQRDDQPVCQAMLIDVLSKKERCFPDLEGMVAYLHAQGPQFEAEAVQVQVGKELRDTSIVPQRKLLSLLNSWALPRYPL